METGEDSRPSNRIGHSRSLSVNFKLESFPGFVLRAALLIWHTGRKVFAGRAVSFRLWHIITSQLRDHVAVPPPRAALYQGL